MSPDNYCFSNEEIDSYLDGELDALAVGRLIRHSQHCADCAEVLRDQQVLFDDLEFAIREQPAIGMPKNFAQLVAARARADMSGVRDVRERRRAIMLSALLAGVALILLGGDALTRSVMAPLSAIWRAGAAVLGFLGYALYDAGAAVAVVLRGFAGRLLFESRTSALLIAILFALALFTLGRMIGRYHRDRVID